MSEIEIIGQGEVDEQEMDLVPDTGDEPKYYDPVNDSNGAGDVLGDDGMTQDEVDESEFMTDTEADDSEADQPGPTDEESPSLPTGAEWAMDQIITVNQEVLDQKAVVKSKQAELKDEKETLESLQDQLNRLILEAAKAKSASEPDPDRYPLLDGPKADINAMFAKPVAIQPLPAPDFDEFYRRKARDTRFDSLALKKGTVEALASHDIHTVLQLGDRSKQMGGASVASLKSITEKRFEEVNEKVASLAIEWKAEWDALQAPPAPAEAVTDSPVEAEEATEGDAEEEPAAAD